MSLFFAIKNKYVYKKHFFVVGVILMILVNFSTAVPRFWMAGVYLGFLVILIKKIRNKYLFKTISVFKLSTDFA